MQKQHFFYVLALYVIAVFYLAILTPISPHEANIFYTETNIVSTLMHWGDSMLPGFLGLRIFFILFGLLSLCFFYQIAKLYLLRPKDAYLATAIFMVLPGILTGFTLANISIVVLPIVLLFVLLYEKKLYWPLPFLMLTLFFIHDASIIFFVAMLSYAVIEKDKRLGIAALAFLIAFIVLAKGIAIGGRPSGHFIEIFGLYAAVFSPLLFLYFFYTMYRILLRGNKTLLWYISFTALIFSLLLSVRQRVSITDFAPYVMVSVVLMLDVLNKSIRVRLPTFQTYYRRGFYVVMTILLLSTFTIIFHKSSYFLFDQSKKHFAHKIYAPYALAKKLKEKDIPCYNDARGRERYQLMYYGINLCRNF